MHREFVLASSNRGKLREIAEMLKPMGFVVRPQSEWQLADARETGSTFVENALIKARHAARLTGLPSMADDSGLVVPALNGAPGIYSARYAGKNASDQANMDRLLAELSGKTGVDRQAYFYCAMVVLNSTDDPAPLIATGRWHGRILQSPRGAGGFGYDPLFGISTLPDSDQVTSAAELIPGEKNRVSHRGKALQELVRQLQGAG